MVNVRFTDKKGKTWVSKFPERATLDDVKVVAKRMNPRIAKVEYYRPKKRR
jgi:hypothetical protein